MAASDEDAAVAEALEMVEQQEEAKVRAEGEQLFNERPRYLWLKDLGKGDDPYQSIQPPSPSSP